MFFSFVPNFFVVLLYPKVLIVVVFSIMMGTSHIPDGMSGCPDSTWSSFGPLIYGTGVGEGWDYHGD